MGQMPSRRGLPGGLRDGEAMRRFHGHRQSLRARRLNLRPPGRR